VSKWQQRSRDWETGEFETVWLSAYKFAIAPKMAGLDLPALYAEVVATKRGKGRSTKKRAQEARTVVVAWADIQTGKVDYLGGVAELLARLEDKREALKSYLERTPCDQIVIADCGDIVEGFENVQSQVRENGLSLMDQVDIAATEFWKTIRLCAAFAKVDVLSIPSNHCQWRSGKGLVGKPNDDWGIHISKRLEQLNAEVGLPVTFHRPSDDYREHLQFDVRGTVLGLAHGHQARGSARVCDWWTKMTHAGELNCDVLLTGHFHFASLRPSGRNPVTGRARWHIQAPTLDNGSAWVRNSFGDDGDPGLAVFSIRDDGFDLTSFAIL